MTQKKQNGSAKQKTSAPATHNEDRCSDWFCARVCPECGKVFGVPCKDIWAYKIGEVIFCSWHCLRATELRGEIVMPDPTTSAVGKTRLERGTIAKIKRLYRQGMSVAEIEERVGVCRQTIWYHVHKAQREKKQEEQK